MKLNGSIFKNDKGKHFSSHAIILWNSLPQENAEAKNLPKCRRELCDSQNHMVGRISKVIYSNTLHRCGIHCP